MRYKERFSEKVEERADEYVIVISQGKEIDPEEDFGRHVMVVYGIVRNQVKLEKDHH